MRFLFNLFNHSEVGQRSLEDVIGIMGKQLRALGHWAEWWPANDKWLTDPDTINVIVEGFTPPIVTEMRRLKGLGARFLIIGSEEPTYTGTPADRTGWQGFNQGTQKEMVGRMKIFPEAAKLSEGILHLVPGSHVTDWYAQFAPSAPAELGFAPDLMRKFDRVPEYEFGFYGSRTRRRHKILKKLADMTGKEKAIRIVDNFKTQDERDREMQRAKVIVQIRKFEAMGLVSSSRCNTALCIGRPVIAEPHELVKPWDEVISFPKTMEQFYMNAMIARAAWRGVYADQLAKFKTKMSPEFCVGEPLRRIGILREGAVQRVA